MYPQKGPIEHASFAGHFPNLLSGARALMTPHFIMHEFWL